MKTSTKLICATMFAALVCDSTCVASAQEPVNRVPPTKLIDSVSPTNALVPPTTSVLTITPSPLPVALPRVTNTITRVGHRPASVFSKSAPPVSAKKSATDINASAPSPGMWPDPMPAQLVVMASQPTVIGEKAVVKLAMRNGLSEKIESARAAVFLLDEQGKSIGHSTKWVIGETEHKPGLTAGATETFHFVITSEKSITSTNLTAKVSFSRLVLEGGKVADVAKSIQVMPAPK